jgi:hypothetical protein
MRKFALIISVVCLVFAPGLSRAADFDPNFVVSNAETEETSSWSVDDVQAFLESKGSGLAGLTFTDIDGVTRRAADIIMNASARHSISPRFLLALMQREQSLVTDSFPSANELDWATGYGVCDSCSESDPALAKYKGFANQVESAADSIRYFIDGGNNASGLRQCNVPTVVDGIPVTPATDATAALYNYTPHVMAQENFWNIWQKYFVRRYPNGSVLVADEQYGYWYILNGERRKISSPAVLYSRFNPDKIVKVTANEILAYPIGPEVKFANYSLLRSPKGTVYLIVDDLKRGFTSRDVFRKLGFSNLEVDDATFEDLAAYPEGPPITIAAAYPLGALLQVPKTGGVYYVQNGVKHPIYGRELMTLYFGKLKIKKDSIDELSGFAAGDPIALRDGELVRSANGSTVYVIADGERQPIASAEAFEKQGWKWENVITVSDKVLALSPLGPQFDAHANGLEISNN